MQCNVSTKKNDYESRRWLANHIVHLGKMNFNRVKNAKITMNRRQLYKIYDVHIKAYCI